MVSPATFRHPSVLGRAVTTVDHISGGRAELGLGAGWHEREHAAFGFPFPPLGERMDVFEEQAAVIVGQWTTPGFSFAGAHYRLDACDALPQPVQRPHPPLIVGGSGRRRSVAVAARLAQEYNLVSGTAGEARALRARLDEACEREGRDPATLVLSMMTTVCLGATEADALRRAQLMVDRGIEDGDAATLLRQNRDTWVCGSVAQAAEQVAGLREAGVERMMLQHLLHDDLEAVALMATDLVAAIS
jgi:alkanesulfonate monooxygenase SsuD/methylene tetrahydromethanopterin reductase-like flavin-dependent oxidoreductase (luciferase family)